MTSVTESVDIRRPIEEVFAFVTDASRIPLWRQDILATTGPVNVSEGTEFVETVNFMGRKPFTMKVVQLTPNEREVIENIAGPGVRPTQTFTFERVGVSTRFTVHVKLRTIGMYRVLEPMLPRMISRNWRGYLKTLKELLEAQ